MTNLPIIQAPTFQDWPDGLLVVDSEGAIAHLNDAATNFIGWSQAAVKGRSVHEVLCQHSIYTNHSSNDCPLCIRDEVLLAPQEVYWTHQNSENVAISFRRSSMACGSTLILFTTCEQQGFQVEELRKLSLFTDINPAPLLELDEQGLILFSNPAMTELMLEFGFDDEGAPAVLPGDLADLVGQALESQGLENVESSAASEEDGSSVRHFMWRFHVQDSEHGNIILLSGLDVTSKKEMEQQRLQYERTLEQEKERTRKEYLAMMVHELRSPLNAVVGYAGILKKKLADHCNDTHLSLFDRIIEGGQQLAEQISTTLDSTRVEAGKLVADITQFDAVSVIREACEQGLALASQKELQFVTDLPEGKLQTLADKQHFKQIAINLISNAVKYTESGTIEVLLSPSFDEVVGKCIILEVKDTGCGVPESEKESIFRLYERQDSHEGGEIEGDGYGLAICCEMLELSHGRIILKSELGIGSSFSAILPR